MFFAVFILLGISIPQYSNAQQQSKKAKAGKADKVQARRVIHRTSSTLLIAQKKVKENKVYTGNLAKAVSHQRYARRLYVEGKFLRAMLHSRRARELAVLAIRANKGTETSDMKYDQEDEATMNAEKVTNEELDKELEEQMPNQSTSDEDISNTQLEDIDVEGN
jgi:hypothetical protein